MTDQVFGFINPDGSGRGNWAASLTPRETQILAAIAAGLTNREIAEQLGIVEQTVRTHNIAIFRKLGVRNRTQAALLAVTA